ncbi:hypothetical protein MPH_11536 [Macrophomina phaseolina MS6]|uniref:Uncharacterized protein n=1 Tax=Macrophomina phaseolina (strain MS6) TaxID=1126212 RepID=K2S3R3_MACPH|nr:hypothetical protein MPH_11536 [Macrophomina phaseolina MS6]
MPTTLLLAAGNPSIIRLHRVAGNPSNTLQAPARRLPAKRTPTLSPSHPATRSWLLRTRSSTARHPPAVLKTPSATTTSASTPTTTPFATTLPSTTSVVNTSLRPERPRTSTKPQRGLPAPRVWLSPTLWPLMLRGRSGCPSVA